MLSPLQTALWLPLGIVLSSLISEDAATATAALLSSQGRMNSAVGFASAFFGIWLGDLALFAGSRKLRAAWFPRIRDYRLVRTVHGWFEQHGAWALVLTRFVPGTRFLTYVTAGTTSMSASLFATVTALCALVWVGVIFTLTHQATALSSGLAAPVRVQVGLALAALIAFFLLLRRIGPWLSRQIALFSRWEFWPAWLFYPPVALMCVWLGIKHRGFALPSAANPGQKHGGIIGESKIEILEELRRHAPASVAPAFLIPPATPRERAAFLRHIAELHELSLPLVLKPDTAQRGAGFCKLTRWDDAEAYFATVPAPVVAQEYVVGPHEAGIFYYRLPGEDLGHIFSITHKEFPVVTGDGHSTLSELVLADPRAALIAPVYLRRFAAERDRVLAAGAVFRLVEAGNHCQGCIFRSGAHLLTLELEAAIDAIARDLPGFFIGRFDIRYASPEKLRHGKSFKIIELNGAASEATDIYDPETSLLDAYRTLYRQWNLVYRIGALNRRAGARTTGIWEVLVEWLRYQQTSAAYPAAD